MFKDRKEETVEVMVSLIGIFLLVYLIWSVNFKEVIDSIRGADFLLLTSAILPIFVRIPLNTYKWKILAKDQNLDVKYLKMVRFYLIGFFFANATPGGVGNYIRVKFLHDQEKDISVSISNVVIDNLIDMISLHILALLALIFLFPEKTGLAILIVFLLATVFIPFVFLLEGRIGKDLTKKIVLPLIPSKYRRMIGEDIEKIFSRSPSIRSLILSFFISFFTWMLCFIQIYPVFLSLGVKIDPLDSISVWSLSLSLSSLPITVSGLGVREWFMMYLSSKYSLTDSLAISSSLLGYLVAFLVPSIIGGLLFLFYTFPNFRNDRRR